MQHSTRKRLSEGQLRAGGTTLIGLTVASALDEIVESARGLKESVDPLTIKIDSEIVEFLTENGLQIRVQATSRPKESE